MLEYKSHNILLCTLVDVRDKDGNKHMVSLYIIHIICTLVDERNLHMET